MHPLPTWRLPPPALVVTILATRILATRTLATTAGVAAATPAPATKDGQTLQSDAASVGRLEIRTYAP
jgi:hypothetical protein